RRGEQSRVLQNRRPADRARGNSGARSGRRDGRTGALGHVVADSERSDRIGADRERRRDSATGRRHSRRESRFAPRQTAVCGIEKNIMSNVPADLRYAKSHEWLKLESDGTATVGISDYAQNSLGDITYVQ